MLDPPTASRSREFAMHLLRFSHLQGLLMNVKPDVFSVLNVSSDAVPVGELAPLDAADTDPPSLLCSSQSSDCSRSADSVSTEDLELSALLSRSSSDEEERSLQGAPPSPVEPPGVLRAEWDGEEKGTVFGVSKPEEAYVTMSSFYQINKSVQEQWRSKTLFWVLGPGTTGLVTSATNAEGLRAKA